MGKFAKKAPSTVKSVVEVKGEKDHAMAWYSKPLCLGRIDLRNGHWYTQDGKRFISSRDAMDYLITIHEMVGPGKVVPPDARAIQIPQLEAPGSANQAPVTQREPVVQIEKEKVRESGKKVAPAKSPAREMLHKSKGAMPKKKGVAAEAVNLESMLGDLLKRPDLLASLLKEAGQKKG
jgi:hypothetical protein